MDSSSFFAPLAFFVTRNWFGLRKPAFVAAVLWLSLELLLAQELLRAGTIFSATQAPLWAAKEGRYFEKYGIRNLEIIQFSGGLPVTRALIGGDPNKISLLKNAPRPNAAKLFIDFMLSAEGQKLLQDKGRSPGRIGIGPRNPRLKAARIFTLPVGSDEFEELGKEFNRVFKVQ